jgi:predicted kinase
MKHPQTLILTIGLPRSGKSTWAMKQGVPVVNPDSVRLALHGQRMLESAEPMVWTMVRYMVDALFIAGHEFVILDATNLTRMSRQVWRDYTGEKGIALVYAFSQTKKEECIKRARETNDEYIIPVIERMWNEIELPHTGECYLQMTMEEML